MAPESLREQLEFERAARQRLERELEARNATLAAATTALQHANAAQLVLARQAEALLMQAVADRSALAAATEELAGAQQLLHPPQPAWSKERREPTAVDDTIEMAEAFRNAVPGYADALRRAASRNDRDEIERVARTLEAAVDALIAALAKIQ